MIHEINIAALLKGIMRERYFKDKNSFLVTDIESFFFYNAQQKKEN
jgi:hypothetical protein